MILKNLLFFIAFLLLMGWLLCLFFWQAGIFIHLLAVLAAISLVLGVTRKK